MMLRELAVFLVLYVVSCWAGIDPPVGSAHYKQQRQMTLFNDQQKQMEVYQVRPSTAEASLSEPKGFASQFSKKVETTVNKTKKMYQKALGSSVKNSGAIVPYTKEVEDEEEPKRDFEVKNESQDVSLSYEKLKKYSKKTSIHTDPLPYEKVLRRLKAMQPYFGMFENRLEEGLEFTRLIEFAENYMDKCNDEQFYLELLRYQEVLQKKHSGMRLYIDRCVEQYQAHCDKSTNFEREFNEFMDNHYKGLVYIDKTIRGHGESFASRPLGPGQKYKTPLEKAIELAVSVYLNQPRLSHEVNLLQNTCNGLIDYANKINFTKKVAGKHYRKIDDEYITLFGRCLEICRATKDQAETQRRFQPYNQIQYSY